MVSHVEQDGSVSGPCESMPFYERTIMKSRLNSDRTLSRFVRPGIPMLNYHDQQIKRAALSSSDHEMKYECHVFCDVSNNNSIAPPVPYREDRIHLKYRQRTTRINLFIPHCSALCSTMPYEWLRIAFSGIQVYHSSSKKQGSKPFNHQYDWYSHYQRWLQLDSFLCAQYVYGWQRERDLFGIPFSLKSC